MQQTELGTQLFLRIVLTTVRYHNRPLLHSQVTNITYENGTVQHARPNNSKYDGTRRNERPACHISRDNDESRPDTNVNMMRRIETHSLPILYLTRRFTRHSRYFTARFRANTRTRSLDEATQQSHDACASQTNTITPTYDTVYRSNPPLLHRHYSHTIKTWNVRETRNRYVVRPVSGTTRAMAAVLAVTAE
jgi:hypothetical protein